ncbi:hypothetical protein KSU42_07540 [Bifidobacterium breve]|jgi:hypothetical protein|uniref:Uncharacterized protein n=1 Tax=Bifidobacterium breve TaxID=1685 RepID=A0AAW4U2N0_BIFBR|nr:hypothetical protein [Bifidobacterium breve]MCB8548236.1 hypothetical protein [Bifidobacterium sp. MSK23_125]MCB8555048.1 hypothetical protein [Bifidobacterium sp. MSK23_139]MBU9891397.1 hypothetical protein [Bifidobacterium breve]MBV3240963.1 hypothetical protein [Bifidobacterium breve]MBV3254859.1 hypothetical protein [Bifidobacterium breve]
MSDEHEVTAGMDRMIVELLEHAYRDLKAVGRNLDLVDMDELEDADDWN